MRNATSAEALYQDKSWNKHDLYWSVSVNNQINNYVHDHASCYRRSIEQTMPADLGLKQEILSKPTIATLVFHLKTLNMFAFTT